MNDTKNILLAWISSLSSIMTAIETKTWITIVSAIVLPMIFFTVGKTVDVLLQIYFRHRDQRVRTGSDSDWVKSSRAENPVTTIPGSDPDWTNQRNQERNL